LELKPSATYTEVKNAYLRLKRLYASETSIISPISDEFSKRKRNEILRKLEKAYTTLTAYMEFQRKRQKESGDSDSPDPNREPETSEDYKFTGPILRNVRRKLKIQIFDVTLETKIRKDLLKAIEQEIFEELPSEAYLRAHLRNYAKYLGLNPRKVADDYLSAFNKWKKENRPDS